MRGDFGVRRLVDGLLRRLIKNNVLKLFDRYVTVPSLAARNYYSIILLVISTSPAAVQSLLDLVPADETHDIYRINKEMSANSFEIKFKCAFRYLRIKLELLLFVLYWKLKKSLNVLGF